MSNINSSLAYEDIEEQETMIELNLYPRVVSISNVEPETKTMYRTVKVNGHITISF